MGSHCAMRYQSKLVGNNHTKQWKFKSVLLEVAASFDLARGTDYGFEVKPGWWRKNISDFEEQVLRFCPGCGVPARLKGHMDYEQIDTYTSTNIDIAKKSTEKKRSVKELDPNSVEFQKHKVTEYSENLRGVTTSPAKPKKSVKKRAHRLAASFSKLYRSISLWN